MVKGRKELKQFVKSNKKRIVKRNIQGFDGISKELTNVYNEFRKKQITESEARTLSYILRTKALVERDRYLSDMERDIIEIKEKLNENRAY